MTVESKLDVAEMHRQIWDVLSDGLPVVLTSHSHLDGDAVGSVLGLWHGLRHKGIEGHYFFQPPTPAMFDFLPGMDSRCEDPAQLPEAYNLVVIDCGTFERIGDLAGQLGGRERTVNIDHHDGSSLFGDLNYVACSASSCGEMIYELLSCGDVPLTASIAECLFTAIVTDTGQFSHEDTTPEALRVCAECVRAGAQPYELVRRLFLSPSAAQVKLRHLALGTLQFYRDGRLSTMEVTEEMFQRTGLRPLDTEGLAEVPVTIQGVCGSALLKEMPGCGYIKVSLRSREKMDVYAVAGVFGGGGHTHAAGCEIADTLENARRAVVQELEKQLDAAAAE